LCQFGSPHTEFQFRATMLQQTAGKETFAPLSGDTHFSKQHVQDRDIENSSLLGSNHEDSVAPPLAAVFFMVGTSCLCECLPVIVILVLQLSALKDVGKDFPSSVWTFEMKPGFPNACQKIFNIMTYTVIICFVGMFVSSMNFCAKQQGTGPTQGPVGLFLACLLTLARTGQGIVTIWGAVVVFVTADGDCSECMHLLNIAWWSYVWLPLIALGMVCCIYSGKQGQA